MKSGSSMLIQNAKGSSSLQMNRHEVLLNHVYSKKGLFWCFRGIFVVLFVLQCGNQNRPLYGQLDYVNKSLIEKWPAIVNRNAVILQHCKVLLDGRYFLPYSPDVAPSDFQFFRLAQHFLSSKRVANLNIICSKANWSLLIRHWQFAH